VGTAHPTIKYFRNVNPYQFGLYLRKVAKEDIEQAKALLKKMNFDNHFEIRMIK
jgi:hypothetical protein